MADLTKITITGPYEAEWVRVPPEEKPPECKAPPEQWGPFSIEPITPPTIPTECKYLWLPVIPNPYIPPAPPAEFSFPFRIEKISGLDIKVPGGTVQADGCNCNVEDTFLTVPLPVMGSQAVVWIERKDESNVLLSCCKSSIQPWTNHYQVNVANGGWAGYPNQPAPPGVKYIELAKPEVSGGEIVNEGRTYSGGDFMPWPGDEPQPFRVIPICAPIV